MSRRERNNECYRSVTVRARGFQTEEVGCALGTPAGNTALCTVGRNGSDLHYRGYNIVDLAGSCEYEEVAHLLIHGKLPNQAELAEYKSKLRSLRGLPAAVLSVLEVLPAATHPMDVLRTYVAARGCILPERRCIRSPKQGTWRICFWHLQDRLCCTGITSPGR